MHAGDTFFIPAGTPHTIGPGMILCEVQEYSDLTYRVYDYGRVDASGKSRELHIHKALDVMNFGHVAGGKIVPVVLHRKQWMRTLLCACRYFAAERWEISASCESRADGQCFSLLTVLSGAGKLDWESGAADYNSGQCWFVPAAMTTVSIQPKHATVFLRAYVPDIAGLRSELKREGVQELEISHIVFD